jgi:hypothetical protein
MLLFRVIVQGPTLMLLRVLLLRVTLQESILMLLLQAVLFILPATMKMLNCGVEA